MKKLVFESKGKRIVFDDFTDERDQDYCGVWAGMCRECAKKYRDILVDDFCDRLDDCGSGTCGVEGCNNEADYYVDFWIDDNIDIFDDDEVIEISRIAIKSETFCTPWHGKLYCVDVMEGRRT